jgi:O-acetyl-ADP-ribose deacetylase
MPKPLITLIEADITTVRADAIVNAANSSLLGGGGVDGAIHRQGGPEILAECRRLRATQYREGLPPGEAVATTAGRLPARWVIHTVGPVYSATEDRSQLLANCHRNALRVADAARIALTTVAATRTSVTDIRFVLFSQAALSTFEACFADLGLADLGLSGSS